MTGIAISAQKKRDFEGFKPLEPESFGAVSEAVKGLMERLQLKSASERLPEGHIEKAASFRGPVNLVRPIGNEKTLTEKLYDVRADFKLRTAAVAMHLDREWRDGLFRQIDSLLDAESWDHDDPPPLAGSTATFLRMLLLFRTQRRPGLGASGSGNLIAAWTVSNDRLTVECFPNDRVKWAVSCEVNGERESAVGASSLSNLTSVLNPYSPTRWFEHDGSKTRS